MLRKFFIPVIIVCTGISSYAYFHRSENHPAGLPAEVIDQEWMKAKPQATLHSGDLVFRHGRGAISNMLMHLSLKDARYSHAGIIHVEHGKAFVYHMIGGEENPSSKMRKDPIEVFCGPGDAHSFGIYRLDLDSGQLAGMDSLAESYYYSGLEFDTHFDLNTDEKMYCSEFVYKVIRHVVRDEKYLSLSVVSGKQYVACDNLYLNPHTTRIYSYQY